jgi:hypothetical protein
MKCSSNRIWTVLLLRAIASHSFACAQDGWTTGRCVWLHESLESAGLHCQWGFQLLYCPETAVVDQQCVPQDPSAWHLASGQSSQMVVVCSLCATRGMLEYFNLRVCSCCKCTVPWLTFLLLPVTASCGNAGSHSMTTTLRVLAAMGGVSPPTMQPGLMVRVVHLPVGGSTFS